MYVTRPILLAERFYTLMPYDLNSRRRGHTCDLNSYRYIDTLFKGTRSVFEQSEGDVAEYEPLLLSHGITLDNPIVCIHVRDSGYLNQTVDKNTDYHNFRDGSLSVYSKTVDYLLDQGYTVVRLGKHSNQYLPIKHDNYIDLNRLDDFPERDKLDVAVMRKSRFIIGMPCGVLDLAVSLDLPALVANTSSFFPYYHGKCRILPRRLETLNHEPIHFLACLSGKFKLQSGKYVHECLDGNELEQSKVQFKECEPDEILAAVKEFEQVVDNNSYEAQSDNQKAFHHAIPENVWFKNVQCWVIDAYLKKYSALFSTNNEKEELK
jgi:putative glycosyltransferase (TIGR04372 family)